MQFRGITLKPPESLILLRKSAKQTRLYAHNTLWQLKTLHPLSTGKMPKNSDSYWFTRCCDVILTTLLACTESLTSSSGNGLKLHKMRKQITCCFTGWHCDNPVLTRYVRSCPLTIRNVKPSGVKERTRRSEKYFGSQWKWIKSSSYSSKQRVLTHEELPGVKKACCRSCAVTLVDQEVSLAPRYVSWWVCYAQLSSFKPV